MKTLNAVFGFGELNKKYIATMGCETYPYPIMYDQGAMTMTVWDTAGPERFGGIRDGFYARAGNSPSPLASLEKILNKCRLCHHHV